MKSFIIGLVFLLASVSTFAGTAPSKQLVEQFIKQSQVEKAVAAEIDGYAQQLGTNARPEEKAQILEYLNATMGWNVIKDQYKTLIQKTFTAEELKASIIFLKSPHGASITTKEQRMSQELAALIATNVQEASKRYGVTKSSDSEAVLSSNTELNAINVEEQNLDGRVYFTGEIENRGQHLARAIRVEVNLFSGGKFVDQYSTYISGAVVPGTTRYFKVSCGCKDSPPAKHDSYKVVLTEDY